MGEAKRERRRLKRAHKRKQEAFARAQVARGAGRELRGMEEADEAAYHLRRGEIADALRQASRAATLNPRDREISFLYLAAAEQSGRLVEQRRALEHSLRFVKPDPMSLIRLAYLCV